MNKLDRIGLIAFCVGCLFFAFLGGALLMLAQVWPSGVIGDAYQAATALTKQQNQIQNPLTGTDQWRRARTDQKGVILYDPKRAQHGYTLYTRGGDSSAYLLDMHGKVVHRWHKVYSQLWSTNPEGRKAQPDHLMYWRRAIMLPDGDLLADYIAAGDTPWGYGIVKLDPQSRVIWKYHGATHHDINTMPNGDVLVFAHRFNDQKIPGFPWLAPHWLEDFLVILDGKTGQPKTRISIFDAFYSTPFRPILRSTPGYAEFDPLHTNSVQYIGKKRAGKFAPAHGKGNQVLLSFRSTSAIALLDLDSQKISWARTGSWHGQHDAHVLPNGDLTLLDNRGNYVPHNNSRVLKIDPASHAIKRRYVGSRRHPFDTLIRGEVQTLANGDWLITESDGGRLFEVTPQGRIVWQYIVPVRAGPNDGFIPVVSSGHRFRPDKLDPAFRQTLPPP